MFVVAASVVLLSGVVSLGDITIVADHNDNTQAAGSFKFKNVPSPSRGDAATKAKFTIVDGEKDGNSGGVDTLHDGKVPAQEDEPSDNFFFNAGSEGGRLLVDLGSAIDIKQVNTYSWHPDTRGPQVFKLYAGDGNANDFKTQPKKGTDPATCGWKLVASVDTRPKQGEGGGQYGVSVSDTEGTIGKYRYLLFDISRTEGTDAFGNTFYSEIDVIDPNAPVIAETAATQPISRIFEVEGGKYQITIDTSAAPDLKEWAEKELAPVAREWYPKIVRLLPSEAYGTLPRDRHVQRRNESPRRCQREPDQLQQ